MGYVVDKTLYVQGLNVAGVHFAEVVNVSFNCWLLSEKVYSRKPSILRGERPEYSTEVDKAANNQMFLEFTHT